MITYCLARAVYENRGESFVELDDRRVFSTVRFVESCQIFSETFQLNFKGKETPSAILHAQRSAVKALFNKTAQRNIDDSIVRSDSRGWSGFFACYRGEQRRKEHGTLSTNETGRYKICGRSAPKSRAIYRPFCIGQPRIIPLIIFSIYKCYKTQTRCLRWYGPGHDCAPHNGRADRDQSDVAL